MSGEASRKKWEAGSWGLREVAVGGLPDDPVELVGLALREDGLVGTHVEKGARGHAAYGIHDNSGHAAPVGRFSPASGHADTKERENSAYLY